MYTRITNKTSRVITNLIEDSKAACRYENKVDNISELNCDHIPIVNVAQLTATHFLTSASIEFVEHGIRPFTVSSYHCQPINLKQQKTNKKSNTKRNKNKN